MKNVSLVAILACLTVGVLSVAAQSFVFDSNFAGLIDFYAPGAPIDLNPSTRTPATFGWLANDGSTGTVTVELKQAPATGTPLLSTWNKGLYMGLAGSSAAQWSLELSFSRPVHIQINTFETYTWYERTFASTDGSPWRGAFGVNGVPYYGNVDQLGSDPSAGITVGLGTGDLTLFGTPSAGSTAGWAQGYFQSDGVTSLELGYGVIIPNGADANGIQVLVLASVPEPSTYALVAGAALLGVATLRRALSRNAVG